MCCELLLENLVREWAAELLPGEADAANDAAATALAAFEAGASLSEACILTREFLESWSRHPSHRPGGMAPLHQGGRLRLVS